MLAHAELFDHPTSNVGNLLQVAVRPGGYLSLTIYELLSSTSSHEGGHYIAQLINRMKMTVFSRQLLGIASSHATGYNGNLMYRVSIGQHTSHQSMPCFMIGDNLLLFLADDSALALGAGEAPVIGFSLLAHPYL